MSQRKELAALKNLLSEADLILSTTELPENRTARCRELLHSALVLTDDLLSQLSYLDGAAAFDSVHFGSLHGSRRWRERVTEVS